MAVRTIRTRVCDIEDCIESAERLELSQGGDRYEIDLCAEHQGLILGLPWLNVPDRPRTRAERASARMARNLERRIRIPEGFNLDTAKIPANDAATELP